MVRTTAPKPAKAPKSSKPAAKPASLTPKTLTIQGVPYVVNEKHQLFVYGSDPLIKIGTTDDKHSSVTLDADWKEKMASFVASYHQRLQEHTVEALKRATELQGAK